MKKIILAAGALLMSGTAYAYAPDMAPDMAKAVKSIWADVKQDAIATDRAGTFSAGESWMGTAKGPAAKPSSDDMLAGELGGPGKPAAMPAGSDYTGVGGPLDEEPTAYPPCSRNVRDRCIQLYERGVGR